MAEAFGPPPTKVLCRYFVHGSCNKGNECPFSHDRHNKMDNVCKFYLKGCCSYADRCRYDHVKPKRTSPAVSKATTQNGMKLTPPPLKTIDSPSSGMVSLKKLIKGEEDPETPKTPRPPDKDWVQASEFVPGQLFQCMTVPSSYAQAAHGALDGEIPGEALTCSGQLLCPYSASRECPYGEDCEYAHGDICELCGLAVLHPGDKEQRAAHKKECLAQHERDMELSFAVARSRDKVCGICMDTVMEKEPPSEQRFGIMSDCTHCFCLSCIRKWRSSKQFDNKTIRSCPECRVQSDFVTPSKHWVETKDEKIKLIDGYKKALSQKPCKYFDQGRGECQFNDKCFYLHAYPDGSKAEPQPRKPRRRRNADGDLDLLQRLLLWDFLQEREDRLESLLLLELEDDLTNLILDFATDSDDDSDEEFYLGLLS